MARFKNTVADVEVKVLARKNTVLVMKEEVQVVLGKSGSAEQTSVEMNSVEGKRTRPASISLNEDNDDNDTIEDDEEHDGVTFKDIKQIMPTCLILIVTVIIMVTVIPYAFSSVIQQMQAADQMAEWKEQQELLKKEAEAMKQPRE